MKFQQYLTEKQIVVGNGAKYGQIVFLAGGAGCFDGDTEIKTEHGYKKISDITIEERVWTFNEKNRENELNVVQKTLRYTDHPEDMLEIVFDDGEVVVCTENHEFYMNDEWVRAKDLEVISKKVVDKRTVYDLSVENNHNYYITRSDILVHNSGKGFASSNFMETSKFKVRDVDELKKSAIKLAKLKGDNPEIANINLGKAEDVFKLHQYVKDKKWKDETLNTLLSGASQGKLPNILFDVTMKDIGDIAEVIQPLMDVGYKPKDMHVVWVLTNFYVAVQQNKERERRVPYDILLKTHTGAANTVSDMLRNKFNILGKQVDGEVYVILGGKQNTILLTDLDTRDTMKGKAKFDQLPGEPIMREPKYGKEIDPKTGEVKKNFIVKSFKYIKLKNAGKPLKRSSEFMRDMLNWDDLRDFIKNNIPRTRGTANLRRRKRI